MDRLVRGRAFVVESWQVRGRSAIFLAWLAWLAWLASACAEGPSAPPLDDGTMTEPGTSTAVADTSAPDGSTSTSAGESETDPEPVCGDEVVEVPEECDLGARNGTGEYCKADCRANACRDGYLGPGETCDDGNDSNADACTNECLPSFCGDGIAQAREPCDDGAENAPQGACLPGCVAASCGDGLVWLGMEACDGPELDPLTCLTFGYEGGELACSPDCLSFDTSGCCQDVGFECKQDSECCAGWCTFPGVCA